jgi:hypothetical protein
VTQDQPIRIGNASGFYGDRRSAFEEMLTGGPLDYLTGDYLAELTMGILGRDLAKDPATGYAKTFLQQMETGLGLALDRGVRIVVNAGGLNPAGLTDALTTLAGRLGLHPKIGYVTGDAVPVPGALTANAYLGAFGIAACLSGGADVVVTGRVTDASLTVGPAIAHFGWAPDDFDALAGATVAGHIIECGCQATGGNYPFFGEIADMHRPGFPIAIVAGDGRSTITKHPGTGGAVTVGTVTAQLLYEIGGPRYLGPDVTTHLDTVQLAPDGDDRVRVFGVKGSPPPATLKVGVTRLGGFRSSMTFVLCGLDIEAKADLVRTQLTDAVGPLEFELVRSDREDADTEETASAFLRVHQTTDRPGRALARAAVELALASYPGATLTTPPTDATPFATFAAESTPQSAVDHVAVLPTGERMAIAPPKPIPATAVPHADDATIPRPDATLTHVDQAEAEATDVERLDVGQPDVGQPDVGGVDVGQPDVGQPDVGQPDVGQPDVGQPDVGGVDVGQPEIGGVDVGRGFEVVDDAGGGVAGGAAGGTADLRHGSERSPDPTTTLQDRGSSLRVGHERNTALDRGSWKETTRGPLGLVIGARAGDKGGDANLGVWARTDAAYEWLRAYLTSDELRRLLPAATAVERHELPHLKAINFVLRGLLGGGVGGSTRFDPQAKSLGEWLRSRYVDIPEDLL